MGKPPLLLKVMATDKTSDKLSDMSRTRECYRCHIQIDDDSTPSDIYGCVLCDGCRQQPLPETLGAFAIHGSSRGPSRFASEAHFDRFHAPTEANQIMNKMNADGCEKRNAKLYNYVLQKCRAMKGKEHLYPKVDYQKTGHPCMENMGKATGIK